MFGRVAERLNAAYRRTTLAGDTGIRHLFLGRGIEKLPE